MPAAVNALMVASTQLGLQTQLTTLKVLGPDDAIYVPPPKGKNNLLGEPTFTTRKEGRLLTWSIIRDVDLQYVWGAAGGDDAPFGWGWIRAPLFGAGGPLDTWYDWYCLLTRPYKGRFWYNSRFALELEVTMMQNPVTPVGS